MTAVGCSKVSKENYDRLKVGMAYEEVVNIIGSPDSCAETFGTKTCLWGSEKKRIKVSFIGSKAVAFSSKGLR
jgi:outer membrane protein assembly factor BamE (lipoprotein component of BamABCDE complex)